MTPGIRRSLVLGLIAPVTVAASLVAAAPSYAGSGYHQPIVGSCHLYGVKGLYADSDTRPAVSCSAKHTALTVAVVRAPKGVDLNDPAASFAAVGTACYHGFNRIVGGTTKDRAQSAYLMGFFTPTKAEQQHGARWIRCDVYLSGGTKLQPLSSPLVAPTGADDQVARCTLGPSKAFTVCSRPHRYRATGVIRLHGRYKSTAKFTKIATKRCPAHTSGRYYASWAIKESWAAGNKVMTCYSKTTH